MAQKMSCAGPQSSDSFGRSPIQATELFTKGTGVVYQTFGKAPPDW